MTEKENRQDVLKKQRMEDNNESLTDPNVQMMSQGTKTTLEQLEMMVMNQNNGGIELSKLDKDQQNQIIHLMHKNEDNSFNYANKRLELNAELRKKELDVSIVNQKTIRYIAIGLLVAFFVLLVLILFFKEEYFGTFLSFVTGLLGGAGLSKWFSQMSKKTKEIKEEEE